MPIVRRGRAVSRLTLDGKPRWYPYEYCHKRYLGNPLVTGKHAFYKIPYLDFHLQVGRNSDRCELGNGLITYHMHA